MQVAVCVRARADGPIVLERVLPVDGLCAASRYFAALLRGGFRESITGHTVNGHTGGAHSRVDIVLPLPSLAPKGLAHVIDHVAGIEPLPPAHVFLPYWPTLVYLGADACLLACTAALKTMAAFWSSRAPCARLRCLQWTDQYEPPPFIDAELVLSACAGAVVGEACAGDAVESIVGALFDRSHMWSMGEVPIPRVCAGDCWCHDEFEHLPPSAPYRDWIGRHIRAYGNYASALLGACDRALARLAACEPTTSEVGECLDACARSDPAIVSAATMTALKYWHAAILPASEFVTAAHSLSLCDLLDPATAARLLVNIDPVGYEDHVDRACDAGAGDCDAPRASKRRRNDPDHRPVRPETMSVVVNARGDFESALREAFPQTADAVLAVVFGRRSADDRDVPVTPDAVLAGGCVVDAVQRRPLRVRLPDSDMDVWVVGADDTARRASFRRIVGDLAEALPRHRLTVCGSVVTLALPGVPAESVQVIFTDARCGGDVTAQFDLSHAAAYYDGRTVWAMWDCAWSLVTRRTDAIGSRRVRRARLGRAARKGFAPSEALYRLATDDAPPSAHASNEVACPADAASLLAALLYRPIDAHRYRAHARLQVDTLHRLLDEPVYLSMPPLQIADVPRCIECVERASSWRTRNVTSCGGAHDRDTRLYFDVPVCARTDLCARMGCRALQKGSLADGARAFCAHVSAVQEAAHKRYRDWLADQGESRDRSECALSVYRRHEGPECPFVFALKFWPASATAVDGVTGEPVELADQESCLYKWAAGRIAFHRVDAFADKTMCTLPTAVDLRVYPSCLDIIVGALDRVGAPRGLDA
ncbi:hypothetical protein pdul_cds_111 [Pandoravirus dulcis]|uniref:Uncharacterized protein n=1 Tax=Pandoravirus dulcis TaxID=1349409 RepID=S4VVB4_9VIRU|nr:hypothetical protein pdul_cds_111 [Pandoravirus dulcis]AGO82016.1 hypothetical protein pdul_cds_111 [Pandoravirus dulcis]